MTTGMKTSRTAWRWIAIALGAAVLAGAAVALAQPQSASSAGATQEHSTVATAFDLDAGVSVLEGDTRGMSGVAGDFASVGQVLWFQWRPSAPGAPSPAGAAFVVYDSGDRAPVAVQLFRGPAGASHDDLSGPIAAVASDAEGGGYEFELPSLAASEFFYLGVETAEPGAFLMTIWQPTPGGPSNDHLVNATSLELVVNANLGASGFTLAEGTAAGASFEVDDAGTPEPRTTGGLGSVWYSWTVPQHDAALVATVGAGAATLHVYQRAGDEAFGGVIEGIETRLDDQPADPSAATSSGTGSSGQFDPSVLLPRADLVSGATATLTGAAGDQLLLQVIGAGDFTLSGSVSGIVPPDVTPPTASCVNTVPTGGTSWARTWSGDTETPVTIACVVEDDGGLDDPEADWFTPLSANRAEVLLTASAPIGTASAEVFPQLRLVCDLAANCTQVGVGESVQIDNAPPVVTCAPAPRAWVHGADSDPAGEHASVSVACGSSDGGSGLATAADASFSLTAVLDLTDRLEDAAVGFGTRGDVCDAVGNCAAVPAPSEVKIDRAPPVVTCGTLVTPPSGWFGDNPTVECTVVDTGAGLANQEQSTITVTTGVAPGLVEVAASSAAAKVCDAVGNCGGLPRLEDIPVDRAAPVVTCSTLPPWTAGTALELHCTAADQPGASGLADEDADAAFVVDLAIAAGSEASGLTPEPRSVCDRAGNCAPLPGMTGIGLDDLGPVVTCAAAPTSWLRADASVACTAVDGGSGLADPRDAAFELTTAFTGAASDSVPFAMPRTEVCDLVGNCTPMPTPDPVRIDRVTPVASCVKPVDGGYDFNITVSCTVRDLDSGLAAGPALEFVLRTSVAPGTAATGVQTGSREVCDLAGNCAVFGPYGAYDIDLTAPPAAPAPAIDAPGAVNVVAAVELTTFEGTRAPFTVPAVRSEIGAALDCAPDGLGLYPIGDTEVTCTARDAADRVVTATFPVRVSVDPALAATSPIPLDRPIPVAGTGFAGEVEVEVAGVRISTITPVGGAVSGGVTLPAGATTGATTVVLRGTGLDGDPLLVVKPVTIADPVGPAEVPEEERPEAESAWSSAVAAGSPSPAQRAEQAERGFVLDPGRWPSEEFTDGGDVNRDPDASAADPWTPHLLLWTIAAGAILLIGASAAAAVITRRRRG